LEFDPESPRTYQVRRRRAAAFRNHRTQTHRASALPVQPLSERTRGPSAGSRATDAQTPPPRPNAFVCISAHYAPSRLPYLCAVLDAIADWPVTRADIVLLTNDSAIMTEDTMLDWISAFSQQNWTLSHILCDRLTHPFHLTWEHKLLIKNWLNTTEDDHELFIYIEDDIVIRKNNISYFLNNLDLLRQFSLIPSFLRYEETPLGKLLVDIVEPQLIYRYRRIRIHDTIFLNPVNPYWAGFILDKVLAREYVETDSFDRDRSATVVKWDVRERAAMGLAWENPPQGFRSRFVVPIVAGQPLDDCLIWHCAQNYSVNSDSKLATLPLEQAFVGHDMNLYRERFFRKIKRSLSSKSAGSANKP
jgi:hypothetical protein